MDNEIETTRDDLREFRRLRNYYRRNFTSGYSDEAFILWCEDKCTADASTRAEKEIQA